MSRSPPLVDLRCPFCDKLWMRFVEGGNSDEAEIMCRCEEVITYRVVLGQVVVISSVVKKNSHRIYASPPAVKSSTIARDKHGRPLEPLRNYPKGDPTIKKVAAEAFGWPRDGQNMTDIVPPNGIPKPRPE